MRDGKVISAASPSSKAGTSANCAPRSQRDSRCSTKPRELDDAALMTTLGTPGQHPEGRFLPETYLYTRGDSDLDVLRRAHEAMDAGARRRVGSSARRTPC